MNCKAAVRNAMRAHACIVLISAFAFDALAYAQTYPSRPIRFIDAYAPSGSSDIMARIIGQHMAESWGQQVVVDNRPGGNAVIGTDIAAKAPADGYTLLMMTSTLTVQPSLYRNLPYNLRSDFAPVALVATTSNVLVVNPSTPASTVKEFIALAKARAGKLTYGSGGNGTGTHMSMELLQGMAGLQMTHVPYKGSALALTDIMGGHIDCGFSTMTSAIQQIRSGRLKALAVSTSKRSAALPDVPTIAEAGVRGYDSTNAVGVLAPAKTPRQILARLNGEIVRILGMREVRERLASLGTEPAGGTPDEFRRFIDSEIEKWARVVKASGMEVQAW
jgi:tripartite-type tricarboxylate transporter receptor subunit TctC